MKNIDQNEFLAIAQDDNSVIIDVRRPDECNSGMVPNAKMINLMDHYGFSRAIDKLDRQKHYLVYCRSGVRSKRACRLMESVGFGNTYNLKGGMLGWNGPKV